MATLDVVDKWNPDYPDKMKEQERLLHELNHYSDTFPFWTLPFVPQPREPYMGEPKVMVNVPRLLANQSEVTRSIVRRTSCYIQRDPDF